MKQYADDVTEINGFAPKSDRVSLRTTQRNFLGRSGTKSAKVYLCSPEVAIASAITGVITDPRELGIEEYKYEMPEKFIEDKSLFIMPEEFNDGEEPRRGPNIKPIPQMLPMQNKLKGNVLLKVEDDITTDHICPAGANILPIRSNIAEMSKHAYRVIDEYFAKRATENNGGVIVAGHNYGQGSSREQATIIPRYLGIKAVIAKGFARLHLANMANWGNTSITI